MPGWSTIIHQMEALFFLVVVHKLMPEYKARIEEEKEKKKFSRNPLQPTNAQAVIRQVPGKGPAVAGGATEPVPLPWLHLYLGTSRYLGARRSLVIGSPGTPLVGPSPLFHAAWTMATSLKAPSSRPPASQFLPLLLLLLLSPLLFFFLPLLFIRSLRLRLKNKLCPLLPFFFFVLLLLLLL